MRQALSLGPPAPAWPGGAEEGWGGLRDLGSSPASLLSSVSTWTFVSPNKGRRAPHMGPALVKEPCPVLPSGGTPSFPGDPLPTSQGLHSHCLQIPVENPRALLAGSSETSLPTRGRGKGIVLHPRRAGGPTSLSPISSREASREVLHPWGEPPAAGGAGPRRRQHPGPRAEARHLGPAGGGGLGGGLPRGARVPHPKLPSACSLPNLATCP